jgi:hypothetical protein
MFRPLSYRHAASRGRCAVLALLILLVAGLLACEPANRSGNGNGANANTSSAAAEPTIEASPISKTDDQWQVISSDNITLSVTAPWRTVGQDSLPSGVH